MILDQVRDIIELCDHEFVPPLSQRESTTIQPPVVRHDDPTGTCAPHARPNLYFAHLCRQAMLACFCENELAGFLSYIRAYTSPELAERTPSIHITTICVRPEFRGRSLSTHLYMNLMTNETEAASGTDYISTRTWSTNFAHIAVLEKLGFDIVTRIRNARGEGIDTLYFSRRLPWNPK